MNLRTYCVSHLVKHYNLIVANRDDSLVPNLSNKTYEQRKQALSVFDRRDRDMVVTLEAIAIEILDQYKQAEDS